MKRTILFLLSTLLFQSIGAVNLPPEKVYPFHRVHRTFEFYQGQVAAWKTVVHTQPQDGAAWLNFYTAAHCANLVSGVETYDLKAIVREMVKKLPNDKFEYYYLQAWQKGLNAPDYFQLLSKAHEIAPDRYEAYDGLILYHEMEGAAEQVRFFCDKWLKSGTYSPGILRWNYNVLMSIESNGILLTNGENTSIPIWLLQYGKAIRPDVTTAHVGLLMKPTYRNQLFERIGIPALEMPTPQNAEEEVSFYESLVDHLLRNATQPLYFSINFLRKLREKYSENLYLVGLSLKYSDDNFDNIAVLRNNYENHFLTDYLLIDLVPDISRSVVNRLNLNYIPPFILLYRHYEESGSTKEAIQLKNMIVSIAEKGGKVAEIQKYFPTEEPTIPITSEISIKELDKKMKKVGDRLYAAATETSNGAYTQVLVDLTKNRHFDELDQCRISTTDWKTQLPERLHLISEEVLFMNGHPDKSMDCPIQNISYEAAVTYCDWLTQVYNQSDYKRKRFKKVKFRLPSAAEWELAARGGHQQAPYPWGGYYSMNAQKCYLANFYVTEEPPCEDCENGNVKAGNDGGFFPINVDSFFPNDYGLYNMSGNVAEMIAEKGTAMGGSWADVPADCQVTSKQTFDRPSPKVGFRVFMEVIEE